MAIKNTIFKSLNLTIFSFFIILNLFQSYQYVLGILPCDRMTAKAYWYIWGRTKQFESPELDKYMAP
jgi:hypothetical protein